MNESAAHEAALERVAAFVARWNKIQPAGHDIIDGFPGVDVKLLNGDLQTLLTEHNGALALVAHFVDDEELASSLDLTRPADIKAGREVLARIRSRQEGQP